MYVDGFTLSNANLNGYYAPYYNASLAPAALRPCTNGQAPASPYAVPAVNAGDWNVSWQSAGHPVGYYNSNGAVDDASNFFWVRDLDLAGVLGPSGTAGSSYWTLGNGLMNCPTIPIAYYIEMSSNGEYV